MLETQLCPFTNASTLGSTQQNLQVNVRKIRADSRDPKTGRISTGGEDRAWNLLWKASFHQQRALLTWERLCFHCSGYAALPLFTFGFRLFIFTAKKCRTVPHLHLHSIFIIIIIIIPVMKVLQYFQGAKCASNTRKVKITTTLSRNKPSPAGPDELWGEIRCFLGNTATFPWLSMAQTDRLQALNWICSCWFSWTKEAFSSELKTILKMRKKFHNNPQL